jgi:hypothetical protein
MVVETVTLELEWTEYKLLMSLLKETKDWANILDSERLSTKMYNEIYDKLYTQRTIKKCIST